MNKYGVLTYFDKPSVTRGSITNDLNKQEDSKSIELFDEVVSNGYQDFASFEKGKFDFERPIFTYDPESKIPFTTVELADENGELHSGSSFVFVPDEAYSGSGFTLRTYMEEYTVAFRVRHGDDFTVKIFEKTKNQYADEFFPFVYDGLVSVDMVFLKVPAYHFLQIIGFSLGTIREFGDTDFVSEPQIETHFNLRNEELEYDTLNFSIRGNKEQFYFIAGEKVIYNRTGQEFYVDTAQINNDGTIDVSCYDKIALLDEVITYGILRQNNIVEDSNIINNLTGGADWTIDTTLVENPYFSGTIPAETTKREALLTYMQGCFMCIIREGNKFVFLSPTSALFDDDPVCEFNNSNVCSVPEVETLDKITRVHFSRHRYSVDTSQGKTEAFRDVVPKDEETILLYSSPYQNSSVVFYYDDNGTERQIVSYFTVIASGAYYAKIKYTASAYQNKDIIAKAYPYKVSYSQIDVVPNVSSQFKENEVMISDCTLCIDGNNTAIKGHLAYVYSFNRVIKFDSIQEANAGDIVSIKANGIDTIGWIEKKTDYMTGLFSYEVRCV